MMILKQLFLTLCFLPACYSFVVSPHRATTTSALLAAKAKSPKFNPSTEQWEYTSDDQKPEAGYDISGTLLRQGPKPFFIRLLNPDQYEQAVLKFMATDSCDRMVAQGNMDAFFENAQDWAYYRTQAEAGAYAPDYVTVNKEKLVKTVIWGTGITSLLSWGAYCLVTGADFNAIFR
mmetsp:Transcript_19260/g.28495  ORF Transcript_19260/g.28495 Transcript_19260/m.28495 type:complete len:176 (-) Transcript_19260:121-648(-)